ncbi:hypothetical protein BCV69DRAFT_250229 [Microstroma glucosiphilum]|uniref:RlpA-like protein double-psi beta-barrel domain-containing protein n=1 Tax=Pseudomicrostroma glucosiphilum TaxID=1684307 RepID=A0A316U497_9BASI|nr:hypothetical protein BCV69DRAFT_250229 [Pseudomicrostroma glucosiphilum]PWN20096.1 hypothetical protein BCV69DRAFT_250229 [Pseudomicrostroma glucosiphilum]
MKSTLTLTALGALAAFISISPAAVDASSARHSNRALAGHKHNLQKRSYSGQATWYDTETGNQGSCGQYLSNSGYTVAVNSGQYTDAWCGKTITISANGKTHTATIQDECPESAQTCHYGALDMSPALFDYFYSAGTGVFQMEWWFGGDSSGGSSSSSGSSNNNNNNNNNSGNDNSGSSHSSSNSNNDDDDAAAAKSAKASASRVSVPT